MERANPGVVDEYIDTAKGFDRPRHQFVAGVRVGSIATHFNGLAAEGADLFYQRQSGLGALCAGAMADHHPGALACTLAGGGAADATGGAGDDYGFIC